MDDGKTCFCEEWGLEKDETLYYHTSWEGGEEYHCIRPIKYCPICGKELPDSY